MVLAAGVDLTGVGAVLTGLALVITALAGWAANSARKAKDAAQQVAASPAGVLEELRREVELVLDAHKEIVERHTKERQGMEASLRTQRSRAETAESRNLQLQAQLAGLHLDLAQARAEISELGSRVDEFIKHR